jgi:hypothetical protein
MIAFSPTTRATVLANLVRLGFPSAQALTALDAWCATQGRVSTSQLATTSTYHDCPVSGDDLPGDFRGVVLSAHFGSLPHLIEAIAQRTLRTVTVLFGSIPPAAQESLQRVARSRGADVDFIAGGFGMIRRLRKAYAAGSPILLAPDVPWSSGSAAPLRVPFLAGTLKHLSTPHELIERLGLPFLYVLLMPTPEGGFTLRNYGAIPPAAQIAQLADAVADFPHYYERLVDLHRFHESNVEHSAAIQFAVGDSAYVLHTGSMKAWKLDCSVDVRLSPAQLQGITGVTVDDVLFL